MKLVGFLILLAAIFIVAHAVGGRLGPVTTSRSHVQYTGPASPAVPGMGGMNMGMTTTRVTTGGRP